AVAFRYSLFAVNLSLNTYETVCSGTSPPRRRKCRWRPVHGHDLRAPDSAAHACAAAHAHLAVQSAADATAGANAAAAGARDVSPGLPLLQPVRLRAAAAD